MQRYRLLFDFYLDASVHTALAAVSLIMVTSLLLNIPTDDHLLLFLFFGTISCYNFVKYGLEGEKYWKLTNVYHKNIQFFSLVCLFFAAYHAYFIEKETYIGIAVLVLMTGLYAIPVLPKVKNLRNLSGLKIFVVAGVWSGTTFILPSLEASIPFSTDIYIEAAQRFLLALTLILPFEIRDLEYDAPDLGTVPQRLGLRKTKFFGLGLIALFFSVTFLKEEVSFPEVLSKCFLVALLITALLFTRKQQSKYFASFWVEGIPFAWGVTLFLIQKSVS